MDEHEKPKRIDTNDPTNGRYAVTEFPAYEWVRAFRHKTAHKPNWAWRVAASYNRVVQSRCITLPDHTKPAGHTRDFAVIFLVSPGEVARARNLGWSVDVTDDARAAAAGDSPAPEPELVAPPVEPTPEASPAKPAVPVGPDAIGDAPPPSGLTVEQVEAMGFKELRTTLIGLRLSGAGKTTVLRDRLLASLEG